MEESIFRQSPVEMIAKLEKRKEEIDAMIRTLQQVQSSVESISPQLLALLEEESTKPKAGGDSARRVLPSSRSERNGSDLTQFERIAAFLNSKLNAPQSSRAIEEGTGLRRPSVARVLYRTHSEYFHGEKVPGFGRQRVWKLSKTPPDRISTKKNEGKSSGLKVGEALTTLLASYHNGLTFQEIIGELTQKITTKATDKPRLIRQTLENMIKHGKVSRSPSTGRYWLKREVDIKTEHPSP